MSALADQLDPIVTALQAAADSDAAVAVQLDKAKTEIIAAIGNAPIPEDAKAKIQALGDVASTLTTNAAALKTAAQALDDLNPDQA